MKGEILLFGQYFPARNKSFVVESVGYLKSFTYCTHCVLCAALKRKYWVNTAWHFQPPSHSDIHSILGTCNPVTLYNVQQRVSAPDRMIGHWLAEILSGPGDTQLRRLACDQDLDPDKECPVSESRLAAARRRNLMQLSSNCALKERASYDNTSRLN